MINKIKNITKNEEKKRIVSNFFSLSVLQGFNYLLPLLTLPYLLRVIGTEYYGFLAFATATIVFFNNITEYGFNLTATREISIHRDNKSKVVEIFSSVMTVKFLLMILSFFSLTILVFSFEKFSKAWLIYFLTFGTVIGRMLFPIWFFQGMERMRYITYLNILSRTIFTMTVFIFVQNKEDFYIVPILSSFGLIIAGVWSLVLIKKEFKIIFQFQSIKTIKDYFRDGWHTFTSQFGINLYRNTNVFILGLLANETIVAYYSIAEKLLNVIQGLQQPLGQALFPFLSKKYSLVSKKKAFFLIFNYSKYIFGVYVVITAVVYLLSKLIIELLVGSLDVNALINFRIIIVVVIIGGLNYYFGVLGLITMNLKKEFSNAVMITGIFNLLICSVFVSFFQDIGASIALVLSESLLLFLILKKFLMLKKGNF